MMYLDSYVPWNVLQERHNPIEPLGMLQPDLVGPRRDRDGRFEDETLELSIHKKLGDRRAGGMDFRNERELHLLSNSETGFFGMKGVRSICVRSIRLALSSSLSPKRASAS